MGRCGLRGTGRYRPIRHPSACCVCGLHTKSRGEEIGAAVTREATSEEPPRASRFQLSEGGEDRLQTEGARRARGNCSGGKYR